MATLAALALGCGGVDDPPAPSGGQPDVTVSFVRRHLTGDGEVEHVPDLTDTSVAVLLPDGAGGFRSIPAELPENGVYRIPGVPSGTYYLEAKTPSFTEVLVTAKRALQLGGVYAGRPDVQAAESAPEIILDVDGLNPWGPDDLFEITSLEAGLMARVKADKKIQPGTVQLGGVPAFESNASNRLALIDGSRGDRARLTQLVTRHLGSGPDAQQYYTARKVLEPEPFTQVDGVATELSGTFEDVPEEVVAFDWRRSLYGLTTLEAHPSTRLNGHELWLFVDPVAQGRTEFLPNLLHFANLAGLDPGDTTVEFTYGNPFPAEWPVTVLACGYSSFQSPAPEGMSSYFTISTSVCTYARLDDLADNLLQPITTPPMDIQVNGNAAYEGLEGIGTEPVVSWSRPLSGPPVSYLVDVFRFDPLSSSYVYAATLSTEDTSVVVPPGILEEGATCYLYVTAFTSLEYVTDRWSSLLDYGSASAVTGVLVP